MSPESPRLQIGRDSLSLTNDHGTSGLLLQESDAGLKGAGESTFIKVEQSVLIKVTLQSAEKRIEIRGSPRKTVQSKFSFRPRCTHGATS
jgi:hypothetical protein